MAEIDYWTGPYEVTQTTVCFEEIEDLDEIIERGPDWNTIDRIVITLNRPSLRPGDKTECEHPNRLGNGFDGASGWTCPDCGVTGHQ
jgi:hypothetical protein